jgi:hypothetical protein
MEIAVVRSGQAVLGLPRLLKYCRDVRHSSQVAYVVPSVITECSASRGIGPMAALQKIRGNGSSSVSPVVQENF